MRRLFSLSMIVFCALSSAAQATTITWDGLLNDPANSALVGSDLGSPSFIDDAAIANNVALYTFTLGSAHTVTFTSTGYAGGGAQPYFSLFSGTGNPATFLDSNYSVPDIDFTFSRLLGAGSYTVAIGAWLNMSFAENLGAGTLQDGFIGLGVPDPSFLGSSAYHVTAEDDATVPAPVPEPATVLLLGTGVCGMVVRRRRGARRDSTALGRHRPHV